MPPKKCLKKRKDMKQKRAIESKLMQLSLKIDDYIYNKKPICLADAQNYKQTIDAFNESCRKDMRLMQVIEKLGRLLQTIIEEHTSSIPIEPTDKNCDSIICTNSNSLETQNINAPLEAEITQEIEANSTCYDTHFTPKINTDNATNLNLNNDINNTAEIQKHVKDFEITNSTTNTKIGHDTHSEENVNLTDAKNNESNVSWKLNIQNIMDTKTGNAYETQVINYPDDDLQSRNAPDATKTINENTNTFTVKVTPGDGRVNNQTAAAQTVKNKRKKNDLNTVNLPAFKNSTTITPKKPNILNSNKKSKQTKTHLTWIENIKYVREVSVDEYDPKLRELSESFWHNCVFPSDWENEFID
ncbi:putative mediator of RNA polymerase II transcription subunit 24 [Zerene cesonia]|uniref:putative mediator of RNA polymerase II transcription subunit 24 n=1 Tax=Zerene cesonia TaxID=33412 RepID=UPI0018E4DB68|nr:putative mediator of RNA polymerase II transcription subunit 24 [Zerene cesonia]